MPTKQLHNSSLAATPDWLFKQAQGFYERSIQHHSPRSRDLSRRKFMATIQELLKLVSRDDILNAWGGRGKYNVTPKDAVAIIDSLVAQPPKAPISSPEAHSATPAAGDVSEAIRGLTAALERLLLPLAAFAGQGGK